MTVGIVSLVDMLIDDGIWEEIQPVFCLRLLYETTCLHEQLVAPVYFCSGNKSVVAPHTHLATGIEV